MAKKTVKTTSLPVAPPSSSAAVKVVRSPKESKEHEARERRWKAEDALRTMKEYEKIKSDGRLMGDVKKLAKEEIDKLKKIC